MLNTSVSDNATAPDPGSESDADVCQQDPWDLECVTRRLWQILAPVIIVVGLLGNLLVVIVFSRLHFSKSSTLVHMFILAITDSVILCLGPTRHWALNTFDFDIRGISDAGCKLHLFLLYTTLDYSAWILVSVTVERALSVLRPLHVRGWFTVRRTLIRLSVILVVIFCINGHYFFSNGIVGGKPDDVSSEDDSATPSYSNSTSMPEVSGSSTADPNSSTPWFSPVTSWTANGLNGSVVRAKWVGKKVLVLEAATSNVAEKSSASEARLTVAPSDSALYSSSAITASSYASSKVENTKKGGVISSSTSCDSLTPTWENFEEYTFVYIDMCVESFFPFLVMAVCNSFIVTSLRHAKKNRPRGTTRRELQQFSSVVESATRRAKSAAPAPHPDHPNRSSENGHAVHLANGDAANRLPVARSSRRGASPDYGETELFDRGESHQSTALARWRERATSLHGAAATAAPAAQAAPSASSLASQLLQSQNRLRLSDHSDNSNSLSRGVTRMLVLVTTVFLLATLPSALYFIIDSYLRNYDDDQAYVNKALDLTQAVTNLLQYGNYGCNFMLYSMHSKRFRMEVKFMFGLVNGRFRRHFNSSVLSKGTLHDSNTRSRLSTQRRYQPPGRDPNAVLSSVSEAEAEERGQEWVSGSSSSAAGDSSSGVGPGEGPRKSNGHLPLAEERKPRSGTDVTCLSNSVLVSVDGAVGGDSALLRRGSSRDGGHYPLSASVTSAGSHASLQSDVRHCDVTSAQSSDDSHSAVSISVGEAGAYGVKYRKVDLPKTVSGGINRERVSAVAGDSVIQTTQKPCGRLLEQQSPSKSLPDQGAGTYKLQPHSNSSEKGQSGSHVVQEDRRSGAVNACDRCVGDSLDTENEEQALNTLESLEVRLQSVSPSRRPLKHTITRLIGKEQGKKPEQNWLSKHRPPGILKVFSSSGLKHCRRRKKRKNASLPKSELLSEGLDSISDRVSCAESGRVSSYCRRCSESSQSDQGSSPSDQRPLRNVICVRI